MLAMRRALDIAAETCKDKLSAPKRYTMAGMFKTRGMPLTLSTEMAFKLWEVRMGNKIGMLVAISLGISV